MAFLAHWPRWSRRLVVVAAVLVGFVALVRLVLDPIAGYLARRELAQSPSLRADFKHLHVTVLSLGATVTNFKLIEEPGGDWDAPLFYAPEVHVGLDWRRLLLHGLPVARVRLFEPKVVFATSPRGAKEKAAAAPDISKELQRLIPFKVDRVEIFRGELVFRDMTEPHHPELWVHRLDLAAENVATRSVGANERPAIVAAKGAVGRSGRLRLFVSADPLASPLAFAGRFELRGLEAAELYDFIEPKTKLQAGKGTVDVFAEFEAKGGRVEGGVKPVLENIEVAPAEPGFGDRLKAWLANLGVKLLSDRVPGRNAVATLVPIEGRFAAPDVQLWPAVFGVVRNAFVEGIAGGFAHLPPAQAPQKEGLLQQAKDALNKKKGPPKAQPPEEKTK
jgi:hypothetical protein